MTETWNYLDINSRQMLSPIWEKRLGRVTWTGGELRYSVYLIPRGPDLGPN